MASRGQKPSIQRGLWKGAISFGLVNIPVKLVSAKEQEDLHFSLIDPSNLSPVGYKYYNKKTGDELAHAQLVKAYEHKPGSYVIFTAADFKKANLKATQTIDIETFVDLAEIDPVFFEKAYYLLPLPGGEKAYQLLRQALSKSGKVAVAKIVLHTRQHLAALIPRGHYLLLEVLHFAQDVRELRDIADWRAAAPERQVGAKEIEMAEKLIADMTSRWKPEVYRDTYRADIMKRVQSKVRAGKATEITPDQAVEQKSSAAAQVIDLMPLLRKSLEEKKHKKPATARRKKEQRRSA